MVPACRPAFSKLLVQSSAASSEFDGILRPSNCVRPATNNVHEMTLRVVT